MSEFNRFHATLAISIAISIEFMFDFRSPEACYFMHRSERFRWNSSANSVNTADSLHREMPRRTQEEKQQPARNIPTVARGTRHY